MDIEGLGFKTVDLLLSEGWVKDPADLFTLSPKKLLGSEGWGGLRRQTHGLDRCRSPSSAGPSDHCAGDSARRGTVARSLARRFRSMEALLDADEDELGSIDGIGPEIVQSVRSWCSDRKNRRLMAKLAAAGVDLGDPVTEGVDGGLLTGFTLVITGTLDGFSREAAKSAVEDRGGKVTSSVSAKTTAVITGESPGAAKVQKAIELGIPMVGRTCSCVFLPKGRRRYEDPGSSVCSVTPL